MVDFNKRLVEVYEVLKHIEKGEYLKLPKELINSIIQNKDNMYNWKYDITKKLSEQNLHHDTICILSYLNMKFFLNEKQKDYFKKLHSFNSLKIEKEKNKKYNPYNFFKYNKKNICELKKENKKEEKQLIKYKENIFIKLKNIILNFFHNK